MTPEEAGAAAVASGKGTCQVCNREITLSRSGWPKRQHNQTIDHGNGVTSVTPCRGSDRPPVEYVDAYNAARGEA